MALTAAKRKELLEANLPQSRAVRARLKDYLDRTGLAIVDFAARINYSYVSLQKFISGRYEGIASNDAALRAAIIAFIDAHPIGEQQVEDGRLYETENVRLLRRYFYDALDNGRAVYLEGDPGTQKSFVLQHLVAELNRAEISRNGHGRRAYYIYCPAKVRPCGLLKLIAQSAGSISSGGVQRVVRNLRFDFRDRRVLLVFDEAQHLDVDCLETVRELYDLKPHFSLMFAGSHQLQSFFVRNTLQLEQWQSRFHAGKRLPGISPEEAAEITRAELGRGIGEKKVKAIIEGSYAQALGSEGAHRYISARRLFGTLRDLRSELDRRAQGATA